MKAKWIPALISALLMVSFLLGCKSGAQNTLKEEFKDNGKNQPYAQGIPLPEMDFTVYFPYVTDGVAAINMGYTRNINLPCDVDYFQSKGDKAPALTLQKGTEVYILSRNNPNGIHIGYGLQCWPDYEAGWRYGQPLITHDFPLSAIIAEDPTMYYVKTEQLLAVAGEFYDTNKISTISRTEYQKKSVLFIDRCLYLNGAFCSPDLIDHFNHRDEL